MWMSFILAAALALITGLSYAELSSIFPESAGEYVFVKNAFENDFLASFIGYVVILLLYPLLQQLQLDLQDI